MVVKSERQNKNIKPIFEARGFPDKFAPYQTNTKAETWLIFLLFMNYEQTWNQVIIMNTNSFCSLTIGTDRLNDQTNLNT